MNPTRFRPRFTVRFLMLAVVVVALLIRAGAWAKRRFQEARTSSENALIYHRSNAAFNRMWLEAKPQPWLRIPTPPQSSADREFFRRRAEHHEAMILKYEQAVRYPWWPVAPDPAEPD